MTTLPSVRAVDPSIPTPALLREHVELVVKLKHHVKVPKERVVALIVHLIGREEEHSQVPNALLQLFCLVGMHSEAVVLFDALQRDIPVDKLPRQRPFDASVCFHPPRLAIVHAPPAASERIDIPVVRNDKSVDLGCTLVVPNGLTTLTGALMEGRAAIIMARSPKEVVHGNVGLFPSGCIVLLSDVRNLKYLDEVAVKFTNEVMGATWVWVYARADGSHPIVKRLRTCGVTALGLKREERLTVLRERWTWCIHRH